MRVVALRTGGGVQGESGLPVRSVHHLRGARRTGETSAASRLQLKLASSRKQAGEEEFQRTERRPINERNCGRPIQT